jgi:antitoxin (DNA-binding transcriptional repressor) of toxin-antitoxin stability system
MATVHISEAEAVRDFAGLLAKVRAGTEVVIDNGMNSAVLLRPLSESPIRSLSDSLRLAREHASPATPDDEFAADVEAAVNSHQEPLDPPEWD